ncbi:MAG: DUF3810 domain-containing protein [Clostridia bacterium]|nr:DUF3810 domain-containing protein [Clostridia bacterium]
MVKDFFRKHISLYARICTFILAFCITIKLIALASCSFADFFNRHIASLTRSLLSYLTAPLPFSLAEAIILAAIPAAILFILYCIFSVSKRGKLLRTVFNLIGTVFLVLSVFLFNFSVAYDCTPIEEKLDMPTGNLTVDDLYDACDIVLADIKMHEPLIARDERGAALMPYSYSELNKRIMAEYSKAYDKYDFLSPLYVTTKRIALSVPLSYTGIAGMYTPYTGEANINTNHAPYSVAFTVAHEMAHQRGIGPEDEANFVAFLVLYQSEDPFLRYSGLMEVFDYMTSSLYKESPEMFIELLNSYTEEIKTEYIEHYEHIENYDNETVREISETVNDTYLKTQGQTEGTKSYGLVTDLATAYFLELDEDE